MREMGIETGETHHIVIAVRPGMGFPISTAILGESVTILVYDDPIGREIYRETIRDLARTIARTYSQPLPKKSPFMRGVKNRPWHCVFSTPKPEPKEQAQMLPKAPFQRGKEAPQDRTRRKRRKFLQKLRAR